MYALSVDSLAALDARASLFQQHMEPLLEALEAARHQGIVPADFIEVSQYLQVCRWPFRRLEYSFALDALLEHLRPGDRYLDAGSGATPLAFALARRGIRADACDLDARVIERLRALDQAAIFGAEVEYTVQHLTGLSYPDETFDAVSCISVLEHIPAPYDQLAIDELLRVLKPGGLLVVTVDFAPRHPPGHRPRLPDNLRRAIDLARIGGPRQVVRRLVRKARAQSARARRGGEAHRGRVAHQCFQIEHIERDILPHLLGVEIASRSAFAFDLRQATSEHARRLWSLEPGIFDIQERRLVLPAGFLLLREPTGTDAEPQLRAAPEDQSARIPVFSIVELHV